ncbi:hypothetical protein FQN57_001095 [Myotisia sp. PD_48]|nr:hypothetical protein FQN57_001095 [Myotisia sp. PD_48]
MAPTQYPSPTYLIIGAGCFGASTALHLQRAYPDAHITLVDRTPFPCPAAAAHDLNKIIRAEYDDIFYMKLALEAMDVWKSDPIFQPYFHQTGVLYTSTFKKARLVTSNYHKLSEASPIELIDPATAIAKFDILKGFDPSPAEVFMWSPQAGWGDAENALRSVINASIQLGVRYISQAVARVLFDPMGNCIGAQTGDGTNLLADRVILCTGAGTARLLADSAPNRPNLQVNGRMAAAAAIMCAFRVPQDELCKFKNAPILVNSLGSTPGESIPPGQSGLVKCTYELSFTNKGLYKLLDEEISCPPEDPILSTWNHEVSQRLKDEVHLVKEMFYGNHVTGLRPERYRMCWDSITPNQDFIISAHPDSKNLYIAGGGSFHGWKFMANIGRYVVQMMKGDLDEQAAKRWAWDRKNEGYMAMS